MFKLESLAAFASIAEAGSITGAARRLGLSKSVISERLVELERHLDARLVNRTTRALQLSEDGAAFYARAKLLLREAEAVAAEIRERRGKLTGPLRISAPVSFGTLHLAPALIPFLTQNPGIDLTLDLEDRFVDLLREGYDAVIRHGPVDDRRIIVKRLTASRRFLVASPDYLKRCGEPASLDELEQHRGIIYTYRGAADWRFRTGRKFVTVQPQSALRVNNGLVMRDAAIGGLGIALLTTFILHQPLRQRAVKVIDVGAEAEGATIYVAYPQQLRTSAKIRALTACLQESFGSPAYWDQP